MTPAEAFSEKSFLHLALGHSTLELLKREENRITSLSSETERELIKVSWVTGGFPQFYGNGLSGLRVSAVQDAALGRSRRVAKGERGPDPDCRVFSLHQPTLWLQPRAWRQRGARVEHVEAGLGLGDAAPGVT